MNRTLFASFAAGAMAILVCTSTPARAEDRGVTSGPAAGGNIKPSTAAPEKGSVSSEGQPMKQGEVAVGAPGTTSKPGTEAGPAPRPPGNRSDGAK